MSDVIAEELPKPAGYKTLVEMWRDHEAGEHTPRCPTRLCPGSW